MGEHWGGCFAKLRRNRLQSSNEISPKAGRIVVPLIQREPGDGTLAAVDPFAQQRGLAEACRGGDEGELAVQASVQPLEQARARDEVGSGWRNIELGLQQGGGHSSLYTNASCKQGENQPVSVFHQDANPLFSPSQISGQLCRRLPHILRPTSLFRRCPLFCAQSGCHCGDFGRDDPREPMRIGHVRVLQEQCLQFHGPLHFPVIGQQQHCPRHTLLRLAILRVIGPAPI